jgi:hypothetical protein
MSPAKGQWVCPNGDLFQERMIPVMIACTNKQIRQIADMTAKYYEQKAVMYWEVSNNIVVATYE